MEGLSQSCDWSRQRCQCSTNARTRSSHRQLFPLWTYKTTATS